MHPLPYHVKGKIACEQRRVVKRDGCFALEPLLPRIYDERRWLLIPHINWPITGERCYGEGKIKTLLTGGMDEGFSFIHGEQFIGSDDGKSSGIRARAATVRGR